VRRRMGKWEIGISGDQEIRRSGERHNRRNSPFEGG